MREWYDIKDRGTMGSDKDEIKEVTILARTVRWTAEGLEYEADAAHRRRITEAEGLEEDSKAAASLAAKEDNGKAELDEMDLVADEHRRLRSEGATLNYLGQDRSDIQYAVKEICQGTSRPTEEGKARIKRVARYLVGAKRLVWKYHEKENDDERGEGWMCTWTPIGRVDGREGPRAQGLLTVDGVGVEHWSRTQKARALSSGEAEYHAMVTGCAEGLGMQSLAEDLGWKAEVLAVDRQQCREGHWQPQRLGQASQRGAEVAMGPRRREGGPGEVEDRPGYRERG